MCCCTQWHQPACESCSFCIERCRLWFTAQTNIVNIYVNFQYWWSKPYATDCNINRRWNFRPHFDSVQGFRDPTLFDLTRQVDPSLNKSHFSNDLDNLWWLSNLFDFLCRSKFNTFGWKMVWVVLCWLPARVYAYRKCVFFMWYRCFSKCIAHVPLLCHRFMMMKFFVPVLSPRTFLFPFLWQCAASFDLFDTRRT